jgi:hypothetical protein
MHKLILNKIQEKLIDLNNGYVFNEHPSLINVYLDVYSNIYMVSYLNEKNIIQKETLSNLSYEVILDIYNILYLNEFKTSLLETHDIYY